MFSSAVLIEIHLLSAVIIITMVIGKGVKCSYSDMQYQNPPIFAYFIFYWIKKYGQAFP